MDIFKLIFLLFLSPFLLYYTYGLWAHPETYLRNMEKWKKEQSKRNKHRFFKPIYIYEFNDKHSDTNLWIARIASLILVIFSFILIVGVFMGIVPLR